MTLTDEFQPSNTVKQPFGETKSKRKKRVGIIKNEGSAGSD